MAEHAGQASRALEHATLVRSLLCRQCGYDLRALPLAGQCPECGCPVLDSVQAEIDPAASRLPTLSNPRGVGNAMVAIMALLLLGVLLLLARPVLALPLGRAAVLTPAWLPVAAAVVIAAVLIPVLMLRPPGGAPRRTTVRRDVRLLAIAVVAMVLLIVLDWWSHARATVAGPWLPSVVRLATLTCAVVVMIALRRVLLVIGEHSREFRTARWGRQRIHDLIAAVGGIALGELLRLAGDLVDQPGLRIVGTVVQWACTFMLVVGQVYLVVNAWWIRRALVKPPLRLEDLVGVGALGTAPPSETGGEEGT